MGDDEGLVSLDEALPEDVRSLLEERFWRPIERAASLEAVVSDTSLVEDPARDPFFFADHGVVHVRDIARGVVELAGTVDGVLLPRRDPDRQGFVVACGVALAYLHDIGMVDPTPEGRRIHPAYAAHSAFGPEMDDVVELLTSRSGPVMDRLRAVDAAAPFGVPAPVVLRELLSLSLAHSKTTVPAPLLDDPAALRGLVHAVVMTDLDDLRAGVRPALPFAPGTPAASFYDDPVGQPFRWLTSRQPEHVRLVDDVVDAVRVLRSADALRQRGSVLRTAGGYEVFMEARTGEAVYALRTVDASHLLWARVTGSVAAGEANVKTAWVTPEGDLRVAFHRGAYLTDAAFRLAVELTASAVADIQADVLPSLVCARERLGLSAPERDPASVRLDVERPHDRPDFADAVVARLEHRCPDLVGRVWVVADVESADAVERSRYHAARRVDPLGVEAGGILDRLGEHGLNTAEIDPASAFEDVRVSTVVAGETLVAAGSPPAFVYVPTGPGLVVVPQGGYAAQRAGAWVALGATGVVRGAGRNSDVVAEADVEVVMVPGELFLRAWFRPYDASQLRDVLHTLL